MVYEGKVLVFESNSMHSKKKARRAKDDRKEAMYDVVIGGHAMLISHLLDMLEFRS